MHRELNQTLVRRTRLMGLAFFVAVVVAIVALVATPALAETEKTAAGDEAVSEAEVKKLLAEDGDRKLKVRAVTSAVPEDELMPRYIGPYKTERTYRSCFLPWQTSSHRFRFQGRIGILLGAPGYDSVYYTFVSWGKPRNVTVHTDQGTSYTRAKIVSNRKNGYINRDESYSYCR